MLRKILGGISMLARLAFGLAAFALVTGPAAADQLPYGSIVYLTPASPETSWYTMTKLPSFILQPGATLIRQRPAIGSPAAGPSGGAFLPTEAGYSPAVTPTVADGGYPTAAFDLDCSDVRRRVVVSGADPYGLDADGDGIGCDRY